MAYHKREQSKDITSNTHATPLPTYYSQQLPRWTSKSAFENQKAFEVKAEPFVPSYPQFAAPMPRFDEIPLPPRPQRQRLPRKAILIPWILAAIFFLSTRCPTVYGAATRGLQSAGTGNPRVYQ